MNEDTIVAIATAPLEAAISIIRMSGPHVFDVLEKIFTKDVKDAPSHTMHYGFIVDEGKHVDEVLVSVFKGKHTFTGENMVEINCHGGVFITHRVLEVCLKYGARMAEHGEFSKRAFLNGRIDLSQAESIADMISASTTESASLALKGIEGRISSLIKDLKENLIQIVTQIEVNIDYPEYDSVEELTAKMLLPLSLSLSKKMNHILKNARNGQLVKEGITTAIIGKPNVGKSSLLNALLQEEKAIVTHIAGTTRDIVEGDVNLNGLVLHIIDTAGIHETEDVVERIGVEKSLEKAKQAQLVLVVLDGSRPLEAEDEALLALTKDMTRLIVINKKDQGCMIQEEGVMISAKEHQVEALETAIKTLFEVESFQHMEDMWLSNTRHIHLLTQASMSLNKAIDAMKMNVPTDLIVTDLYDSWEYLREILGEQAKEDLLDELFSRFCIGK